SATVEPHRPSDAVDAPGPESARDSWAPSHEARESSGAPRARNEKLDQAVDSHGSAPTSVVPPLDDPGPAPTYACTTAKDANGFFWRASPLGKYVAYVPASYDGTKPMRLVVGLHGCGDTAYNFATWGVNPWDGRATQEHIGISLDGATGGG